MPVGHMSIAVTVATALWTAAAWGQTAPSGNSPAPTTLTLPAIEVVGTTPLPGIGIDRDKLPANVQTLPAPDTARDGPVPLASSLDRRLGSVNLNDNEDNPYHPDVQYRGFTASPVLGTSAGLAVYQNGVRLNEPFGDNLAWDLVPDFAIDRLAIIPTNPLYGLNALGGALVMTMKNGFNYQGGELEISGGWFGNRQGTLQYGLKVGDIAAYIGANAAWDDGYRKLSQSRVKRIYADIGAEGGRGSLHLGFTGADNLLAGLGPTPIQLVDRDRTGVFVSPQYFRDTLLMPTLTASYNATDSLSLQGNVYVRSSGRGTDDGNITDVTRCGPPLGGFLCLDQGDNPLFDAAGRAVPDVLRGLRPGENDITRTTSLGVGGSLQATWTAPLLERENHLVFGLSVDHGDVDFSSRNEVATIDPTTLVTTGTGIIVAQPDGSLDPIRLETTNSYYGLYASDTFNLTPELALTAGGRYNLAFIRLIDKIGTALNGNNRFSRFNPAAGLTYKVTPALTAYAGYAEANRTPTAGEIGCSDPARPCTLDVFLSADPPGLQQVVARTYEAGLRGQFDFDAFAPTGRVEWNFGLFRTDLDNDILTVASAIVSTGFFQNIGGTRRQGIEAGLGYKDDKWRVSASYSLVDATFQSPVTLASPNNPFADADGNIQVKPGDHLPGIPQHRLKIDVEYAITEQWRLGGDLIGVSSQYYFNDQSNQNPPLPGYIVVDLRSSYRIADNVELFALIRNLFDSRYATYGIFNDPTKSPLPGVANPSDPRFVSVARPFAAYAGVRVKF